MAGQYKIKTNRGSASMDHLESSEASVRGSFGLWKRESIERE